MQRSTGAFSREQINASFTLHSSNLDDARPAGEAHRGLFIAVSAAMVELTETLRRTLPALGLPAGTSGYSLLRSYENEQLGVSFSIIATVTMNRRGVCEEWLSMLLNYALMLIEEPIKTTLRGEVAKIGIQPLPWALPDTEILRRYGHMSLERAAS